MLETKQGPSIIMRTNNWIVIVERDSDGQKSQSAEYSADASGFDPSKVLSKSEEVLQALMASNIAYFDAPEGDFHAKMRFLINHDIDRVIAGVIRRVLDDHHDFDAWSKIQPERFMRDLPESDFLEDRFGIKVGRLKQKL